LPTSDCKAITEREITGCHIGDPPILPDLLSQIPAEEEIPSVTADGAYDTRKCHDAMHCVKLLGQRLMARDFDR
jgi:hypothetical protein